MKCLVIGCGSIGKRHIKNILLLGHEVTVYDENKEAYKGLEEVRKASRITEAIKATDAVIICTPNHLHTVFLEKAIREEKHVFVEKPVAEKLEGLEKIKRLAKEKNLVIQVGCNLRFHPVIKKTKKWLTQKKIGELLHAMIYAGSYLPSWRKENHRNNYSVKKETGGGVILDYIHEIDYAMHLVGIPENVIACIGKATDITIDTEDYADVILKYKRNLVVTIHVNYFEKARTRWFRLVGTNGVIEGKLCLDGDVNKHLLKIFTNDKWESNESESEYNLTYIEEIEWFFSAIQNKKESAVIFEEGIKALKIAVAAKQSAEINKQVKL